MSLSEKSSMACCEVSKQGTGNTHKLYELIRSSWWSLNHRAKDYLNLLKIML